MKARVVRTFIDKYSMKSIAKGAEIEISEERFSELTTGPRGIFVEEIKVEPPKEAATPIVEEKPSEKKKRQRNTAEK